MQAHRLVGKGLHHSQLHHPVRQQAQIPVLVAFRRWTAGQGDEMGLPKSSSFRYRFACTRSFSAPSKPASAKRRLRRNTVPSDTSKAWATWGADHPSPVFSRTRVRLITRAEPFPARTIFSSCSRCSDVSLTANFSLTTTPPHDNICYPQITTLSQLQVKPSIPNLTMY